MKKYILLIINLLFATLIQAQVLRNVVAEQLNDNIIINYDLASTSATDKFTVELFISLNGGHSWSDALRNVSGEVGPLIAPGYNKEILWNVFGDRLELVGDDIQFKVRAYKSGAGQANSYSGLDGNFVDFRDGNSYKWVKIGNQIWMAENLRYQIGGLSSSYNNEQFYLRDYGLLYSYAAALDACPEGWHLPSNAEWEILLKELGGVMLAGPAMKTAEDWAPRAGTDVSGFGAKPGGMRISLGGAYMYKNAGEMSFFWSLNENSMNEAHVLYLRNDFDKVYTKTLLKDYQVSIRCIKDK